MGDRFQSMLQGESQVLCGAKRPPTHSPGCCLIARSLHLAQSAFLPQYFPSPPVTVSVKADLCSGGPGIVNFTVRILICIRIWTGQPACDFINRADARIEKEIRSSVCWSRRRPLFIRIPGADAGTKWWIGGAMAENLHRNGGRPSHPQSRAFTPVWSQPQCLAISIPLEPGLCHISVEKLAQGYLFRTTVWYGKQKEFTDRPTHESSGRPFKSRTRWYPQWGKRYIWLQNSAQNTVKTLTPSGSYVLHKASK